MTNYLSAREPEPSAASRKHMSASPLRLLAAIVIVAALLAGCGQAIRSQSSTSPTSAATSAARPAQRLEVVAPVLYWTKTHRQVACLVVLTSLPPAGCSGVPVTGYDFRRALKFGEALTLAGRAAWPTPALRLVGTWNGHAFQVQHVSAARASDETQPGPPAACDESSSSQTTRRLARALSRVHARIHLLELDTCRGGVWALVAVADHQTVSYIRDHFGRRVRIESWLQPV
jgi:hypothetical protein